MSENQANNRPRGTSRGVKILLGVSLALNLLIVGAIGGLVLRGGSDGPDRVRSNDLRNLGLGPIGFALSQEDRAEVLRHAERQGEEIRSERQALARATIAFLATMREDPFDRLAAEDVLELQRNHVLGLSERGHAALLDQLEAMSADERAGFADRLQRSLRRRLGPPDGGPGRP